MNVTRWIIAHFSPTGGTKRIADAIAAGFNVPVEEMDLTKKESNVVLQQGDALLAVLPVFPSVLDAKSRKLPPKQREMVLF